MMTTQEEDILSSYVGQSLFRAEVGSVHELGYFALIEVGPPDEQADIVGLQVEEGPWLTPGLYTYREDHDGFTEWATISDEDGPKWFAAIELAYEIYYTKTEKEV